MTEKVKTKKILLYFILPVFALMLSASQGRYIYCQKGGLKYIKNYTRKEYDGQPQNWAVLQDKRGIIYIGNQGALLEFDGTSWRSIPVPNQSVRSLAMDDNGTVYIGGTDEIGYLAPDAKGTLEYVSLLDYVDDKQRTFSTVWSTHAAKEGIYFKTSKFLFRWNPNSKQIKAWKPDYNYFYDSFACQGELYINQGKSGLMRMDTVNDSLKPVPGGKTFAIKGISMIVPYDARTLLIGTASGEFYLFDGKTMTAKHFTREVEDYLKEKELYHGIRLSSSAGEPGDFALATNGGGLLIIDNQGRLKEIVDKTSGLLDDNIKFVFEDSQGNLWLGLEKGISKFKYPSALSIYDTRSNLSGLVLSVAKHRDILYAGTTNGLYSLASPGKFYLVPGMSNSCWSLLAVDDSLLAATDAGVYRIYNKNNKNIAEKVIGNSSSVLLQSKMDKNRTWLGTDHGLVSLYLDKKNRWAEENVFKDITQEIWAIAEDKNGNLWLGTRTKGVLKVHFPNRGTINNYDIAHYGTSHWLPPGEVHVFAAAQHVMFATREGIFRFDETHNLFNPDLTLGVEFANGSRDVFRIAEDKKKNIWFHSKSGNFQALHNPGGSFNVIPTPVLKLHTGQVNAIYPEPDGNILWFAGNDALIRYDTRMRKNDSHAFPTLIRKVLVNGNLYFDGGKFQRHFSIFDYKDRNIRFEFAAPFFEAESEIEYRCFLEGYDNDWSGWSKENRKDYTNLDSKVYRFRVQARNAYGQPGTEDIFQFKVLPPWYKTWWAFLSYGLLVFLLMFFIVKWRSWRLEGEKQKLEQTVKERTKEINAKNKQLQEQSEKLQEMDKMKSRFFANISHEFRTPLTLIMGPLEQMLSQDLNNEQKKQLDLMLRNSQRLFTLINQLLDLSRFDSGKMRLQAGPQNIIPFLKGILASFESLAHQNKLELKFITREKNIPLYFDSEKLEEVFCNLLLNAAKFTPADGEITVTVKVKKNHPDSEDVNFPVDFVEITVGDTGVGIPKEQLVHIFDRFYQAKSPNLPEHGHKGTGIGLALAKEMVELHHGKIDVHSRTGENSGTEFIIRLPMGSGHLKPNEIVDPAQIPSYHGKSGKISALYKVKEEEENAEPEPEAEPENESEAEPGAREKNVILVVDDSSDVRKYIRRALEPTYTVVEAGNGREGMQIAKKVIPDLIISDIMMPDVDGYELCSTLKNDVKTSHIAIILLTAKASEESIIRGLESGADDYITKPFNTKMLCTRIKNLIDLRRQLQLRIQRQKKLLPDEISVSSIDESFLKELQDIIEKNLSDPEFNIEQMCKKLYMGRTTLFRKIEALTGETPNQFIQSYRLERAAQLLKANFGNITDVAFEVGFSSSAYFTKCFREKFHQTPTTFQASEAG